MESLKNLFYAMLLIAAIPVAVVALPLVVLAHLAVHLRAWARGNAPLAWPGAARIGEGNHG